MQTNLMPYITPSNAGPTVQAYGDTLLFLATGKQTGGRYTAFIDITPPGGGPPPHFHKNEDELFFVIEGRMNFLVEGRWNEVGAGGHVFAPRHSVHTFKNIGDRPSRMLIHTTPSGFEDFFTRSAEEFARPGSPDMEKLVRIAAEHGIHFVQP